jgi:hypothetical protein
MLPIFPAQLADALKGMGPGGHPGAPLRAARHPCGSGAECWDADKARSAGTGTKSGLTEFHVLEEGACIAVLFDRGCAREYRDNMILHGDGHG